MNNEQVQHNIQHKHKAPPTHTHTHTGTYYYTFRNWFSTHNITAAARMGLQQLSTAGCVVYAITFGLIREQAEAAAANQPAMMRGCEARGGTALRAAAYFGFSLAAPRASQRCL